MRLSERSLRIRVEDDGPGIPPEQREDALKPFVRLDPSRNQDKGSGVGLGLVEEVAEKTGARVCEGMMAQLSLRIDAIPTPSFSRPSSRLRTT